MGDELGALQAEQLVEVARTQRVQAGALVGLAPRGPGWLHRRQGLDQGSSTRRRRARARCDARLQPPHVAQPHPRAAPARAPAATASNDSPIIIAERTGRPITLLTALNRLSTAKRWIGATSPSMRDIGSPRRWRP